MQLLRAIEERAQAEGAAHLYGPRWRAQMFYGGYVLGSEPYHPHWATDVTDVYVQAGLRISQCDVLMSVLRPGGVVEIGTHAGYQLAESEASPEFEARTFRFVATADGREVATCTGRLYPKPVNASGDVIGQIGFVGTEEGHRGKGLATALVRMSLNRLWEWGAEETLISTGLENIPALRAYEKAGFRRKHSINEWSKALL